MKNITVDSSSLSRLKSPNVVFMVNLVISACCSSSLCTWGSPFTPQALCVCGQMNDSSLMALCSLLWLQIMCQHHVLGIVRKDLCEQSNWWKVNVRYSCILTVLLVCKTIIVQIYIILLCKYRPSSIRLVQIRVSCSEIRGIFNRTLGTKW